MLKMKQAFGKLQVNSGTSVMNELFTIEIHCKYYFVLW